MLEKKEENSWDCLCGKASKNGKLVIAAKTIQVHLWLLSVFLSIFDFSIWSFLNIQSIVDWCGQKKATSCLVEIGCMLVCLVLIMIPLCVVDAC